jgi:2,3-diphosphopglycerate-independent phosphoglycerate mutase
MAGPQTETTIEAANTPAMDRIAREGVCGMLDPIAPGRPAGSDTAHMAILGYEPEKHYRGRGPFEAKGVGIEVQPGDVAFRCNFATVEGKKVVDRRAGRIKSGTEELAEAISREIPRIGDVQIIFEARASRTRSPRLTRTTRTLTTSNPTRLRARRMLRARTRRHGSSTSSLRGRMRCWRTIP